MLTYVIADLHGRFDLLEAAFEATERHAYGRNYKTITLGDYVDRGPQSRQVIERLIAVQSSGRPLICLRGNHEDMMHETLTTNLEPDWWISNGGNTTLASYGGRVPPGHLDWMVNLPKVHADTHRVFVHAGIDPTKNIDEQTDAVLLWHRYKGDDIGYGTRHVVHGHTPNPNGPEKYLNRTNLDTLAWRTGRLVVAVCNDAMAGPPVDYLEVTG